MRILNIHSSEITGTTSDGTAGKNNIEFSWDENSNGKAATITDICGSVSTITLPDIIDVSGEEYYVRILGDGTTKFTNTDLESVNGCKYLKTISDNAFVNASGIQSFCPEGLHFLDSIGTDNFKDASGLLVFGDKMFPELTTISTDAFHMNLFDHDHATNPQLFAHFLPKLTGTPVSNINDSITGDISGVFNSADYPAIEDKYASDGDYVIYKKLQYLSTSTFLDHVKYPNTIPNIDKHILNTLISNKSTLNGKTKIKIDASNNDIILGNESQYYRSTAIESTMNISKFNPEANTATPLLYTVDLDTTGFYTPDNDNIITVNNGTSNVYKITYGQKVSNHTNNDEYSLVSNGRLNAFNGHFIFRGSILVIRAVADPCFVKDSLVLTNQGYVKIQDINPKIHTIKNKQIQCVTKTIYPHTHLVCIEKNAIKRGVPSQRTYITGKHKIYYKEKMIKAQNLVSRFNLKNVYMVPYNGEILYNILMEKHEKMKVNNITCETLHPMNEMACIYSKYSNYTPLQKSQIIQQMNKYQIDNNEEERNSLVRTLRRKEKLQRNIQTRKFFTHV